MKLLQFGLLVLILTGCGSQTVATAKPTPTPTPEIVGTTHSHDANFNVFETVTVAYVSTGNGCYKKVVTTSWHAMNPAQAQGYFYDQGHTPQPPPVDYTGATRDEAIDAYWKGEKP